MKHKKTARKTKKPQRAMVIIDENFLMPSYVADYLQSVGKMPKA